MAADKLVNKTEFDSTLSNDGDDVLDTLNYYDDAA